MSVSAHQLQAMFARRRDAEHMRYERSAAVHRYYDHWGQVTSRFQNWTNPEYYEQANAQMRNTKDKKEKETQLIERREKLKKLINEEQIIYDEEIKSLQRCKPRSRKLVDMDTLEKIAQQAKERQDIKRKLELEAKLYGHWRHGVDDENALYNSKSDHEVLAKLNWLDKKVEEQMQREKEEAAVQELQLKLHEEQRKYAEAQKEREKLRAEEIKDVQLLQEQHMEALKLRHQESTELRDEEKKLRNYVRELTKEKQLLEESSAYVCEPPEISQAFNLKKIKVLMRNRAETFRNQLKLTVNILERMQPYAIQNEQIDNLLKEYRKELETEEYAMKQIDCMYESEAKYNLQRCEEAWQSQHLKHFNNMKRLIEDEHFMFNARLNENLKRQKDIIELRETHVEAIESSNNQLKKLMEEQAAISKETTVAVDANSTEANKSSNTNVDAISVAKSAGAGDIELESLKKIEHNEVIANAATPGYFGKTASQQNLDSISDSGVSLKKAQSSFQNLNLDVWQDLASARKSHETLASARKSQDALSQRSLNVVTPDTAERPRFARKRIAWT